MRLASTTLCLSVLFVASCNQFNTCPEEPCFRKDAQTYDDTDVNDDTHVTDDSVIDDSVTDDSTQDDSQGGGPQGGIMDVPGDYAAISESDEGVSLGDLSGDEVNQSMDFFVILLNPSDTEPSGYRLHYAPSLSGDTGGGGETAGPQGPPPPTQLGRIKRSPPEKQKARRDTASPPPQPPLEDSDVGSRQSEFHVRNSVEDESTYDVVTATLWALGDSVSIWVDDDHPIDWDVDCDGIIDVPDQYDAYSFDNCDLQTVADIVDTNIIVNLRDIFGDESDINSDERVSVVITPVLNNMPLTHSDDEEWGQIVGSYADPKVDLNDFNYTTNPGSDEQEVIYVFAPDPHGFYNPFSPTTVDEYTSMALSGEIARSFLKLVVYNYRVLEGESDPEELWLTEALAAVGADICGFGAIYYDDAWSYLDAPYLQSLTQFTDDSIVSTEPKGAQYLFMRWLVDVYGTDILAGLTQTTDVGTGNVEALDVVSDAELGFGDLVMMWHVALLSTGVTNIDGDPLVDPSVFPTYAEATELSAPDTAPSTPTPGVYYGANGYQTGFNPRGTNRWMEYGTTADPEENTAKRVVTEGTDFHTFVPGYEYFGYGVAGYGASVTRLTRLEYDSTDLEVQTEGDGFSGVVIRWNDPSGTDLTVENIYSPLSVDNLALPVLPNDGAQIQAVGDISPSVQIITIETESGATATGTVGDVDRWLLDLSDRTSGEVIELAIWIDRRFSDGDGEVGPYDPWLGILPAGQLPEPTVASHSSSTCASSLWVWNYPNKVLEYIYAQEYLASSLGLENEFSGCTAASGAWACDVDWDGDGVLDSDENKPASFMEQVWEHQCSLDPNLTEGSAFSLDYIDGDELDEDETPGFSAILNIGGHSGPEGEEALLTTSVLGGQQYIVVVSGGGDSGTYELSLRQTNY